MKLNLEKVKKLCNTNKLNINELLAKSSVSRTAFYSLVRKSSVLPQSLHRLADTLGVGVSELLKEEDFEMGRMRRVLERVEKVLKQYPEADRQDVLQTFLILQDRPLERLNRSLKRGQRSHIH